MRKTCEMCGHNFYPNEDWKTICSPCYVIKKKREKQSSSDYVRTIVRYEEIEPDMINRLIGLCHPDKHGNSEQSNIATAWLLSRRKNAS